MKISIFIFALVFIFTIFLFPFKGVAVELELPFGGNRIATVPCTCTPPNLHVTVFDYVTKRPIPLLFTPKISKLYAYFNLETSTYLLGSYIINPTPGLCKVTVSGGDCETIYYEGIMGFRPGTGTSDK